MDQVIGIMIVIIVIGLLADKILFSPGSAFCIIAGAQAGKAERRLMIDD